jgi:hypothetical protein
MEYHSKHAVAARATARVWPIAIVLILTAREAAAYTDPGSGALVWQMLVAGFVGSLFYIRKFISWLRSGRTDSEN